MPVKRYIRDYFKPPPTAKPRTDNPTELERSTPINKEVSNATDDSRSLDSSSPLCQSPLSSLQSLNALVPQSEDLVPNVDEELKDNLPNSNEPVSNGTSFSQLVSTKSKRIVKHGEEIVISSDGEDAESISSLESPEELFKQFAQPASEAAAKARDEDTLTAIGTTENSRRTRSSMNSTSNRKASSTRLSIPEYKFSLDSLVLAAVDDHETEAGVAKLKASLNTSKDEGDLQAKLHGHDRAARETMLASALRDDEGETEFQRVINALRRTETFEGDKCWHFFDLRNELPLPVFPISSFSSSGWEALMRDPEGRERTFQSGLMEAAVSRDLLPDELILWFFQSVPSESRDDLRQAYCRILKHAPTNRINSSILPSDIDDLFKRLGATTEALALSEAVVPASFIIGNASYTFKAKSSIRAVLHLLCSTAKCFSDEIRERILSFLFRLAIDTSVNEDATICSELEQTIVALLETESDATTMSQRLSLYAFSTFKDVAFQSRLLMHILPSSDRIALFRCRLAVAFLFQNDSPLTEPAHRVPDLRRIANLLKSPRFNPKAGQDGDFDYGELNETSVLLNIAIDFGWFKLRVEGTEAEAGDAANFDAEVDALADRVKKIFAFIRDSGASHLKRTQAKESLEALHYQLLYSVRSKPPPKKAIFGTYGPEDVSRSGALMEAYVSENRTNDRIPIRGHDGAS